jgi:hypothetical protein
MSLKVYRRIPHENYLCSLGWWNLGSGSNPSVKPKEVGGTPSIKTPNRFHNPGLPFHLFQIGGKNLRKTSDGGDLPRRSSVEMQFRLF